jgi:hypothetical protein
MKPGTHSKAFDADCYSHVLCRQQTADLRGPNSRREHLDITLHVTNWEEVRANFGAMVPTRGLTGTGRF